MYICKVSMYVYMYVCIMYVCMYVCMYVYLRMYVYLYICMYHLSVLIKVVNFLNVNILPIGYQISKKTVT